MKNQIVFALTLLAITFGVSSLYAGSFAPAAGQDGSTAISISDPAFVAWASGIELVRGPVDIKNPTGATASYGSPEAALGNTSSVVSLGDAGYATLTFDQPITDGEGWDFAVFENSFSDTFLELAFVEVSSDGENFFRFDAVSESSQETQIGGFGAVDTTNIHNLAGKYRAGFGTPFDLAELAGTAGLDVNAITHVRVVDVIGCIDDGFCSYDSLGNKVNDPYSTPFASSGFDLAAVGVINAVPEPSSIVLLIGLAIAAWSIRRTNK